MRAGSSAVSSESQAARGTRLLSRTFRKASTATSASVTGEPPAFDQIRAEVWPPSLKNGRAMLGSLAHDGAQVRHEGGYGVVGERLGHRAPRGIGQAPQRASLRRPSD